MKHRQFASPREETFELLATRSRVADRICRCSTWERMQMAIAEAYREHCEGDMPQPKPPLTPTAMGPRIDGE